VGLFFRPLVGLNIFGFGQSRCQLGLPGNTCLTAHQGPKEQAEQSWVPLLGKNPFGEKLVREKLVREKSCGEKSFGESV
jgi:hypothetical protein